MKLTDFSTLALAHVAPSIVRTEFTSNVMTMYLLRCGLLDEVLDAPTGILRGFAIRLNTVSVFDFRDDVDDGIANTASIDYLISQTVDSTLKNQFIALKDILVSEANKLYYPFSNVTLSQFNSAKGLFASKQIELIAGKDIVVTVNAELPELVAATAWRVETGFSAENAGRNTYVQKVQKYRIDMSGKKSGSYEVRVPIANADFTVEVI